MAPVKKPPHQRQGHFLRHWRECKKLSQETAAEACGMSRENYGRIENGRVPYSQDMLEMLSRRYGVPTSHLIDVDPTKDDKPREICDLLRQASPEDVARALAVISALIKH